METSLHRELKRLYAGSAAQTEVRRGAFRIDAIDGEELVEIQHGSLAAIRNKVRALVKSHSVRVVKPIVCSKLLVKRNRKQGPVVDRRRSPKRGTLLNIFDDLVYFTKAFPHPRLTLELVLVDVEEWRYPGHGRRRRYRQNDFVVEDQKLVAVHGAHRLQTAADLCELLVGAATSAEGGPLPPIFHTGHLAEYLDVQRFIAQRIAYCLRQTGAALQVGKQGNALLYRLAPLPRAKKRRRAA